MSCLVLKVSEIRIIDSLLADFAVERGSVWNWKFGM